MRITKFGHACVRVEHDGHTLVIDPGGFTEPEAVDGADAVLVTHEHPDHYEPDAPRPHRRAGLHHRRGRRAGSATRRPTSRSG